MQALGMIETKGLIGAIEAADSMLKAANVQILNKHYTKGGIVTVEITGDVGAVKAAVEAGVETTKRLGNYLSSHVIPRPSESIEGMLVKKTQALVVAEVKTEITEENSFIQKQKRK